MQRLLVINGSYRKKGTTHKCLVALAKSNLFGQVIPDYLFLPEMKGCQNCGPGKCVVGCRYKDEFQKIAEKFARADIILIGTPVYLDFPTPKLLAFLSRMNCYAENTGRKFFADKIVHLHANGYCSGTKAAIGTLMHACEMLGMTIPGRSTTEYIEIWRDKKIRGGMDSTKVITIQ